MPLFRAFERELAQEQQGDPDVIAQATRVLAFSLAMLVWVPVYAVVYTVLDVPICSNIILSGGAVLLGILILVRRGIAPATCGNLLTGAAWYVYTALSCLTGGIWSPALVWFSTLPILSVLLSGPRSGAFWTIVSATTVGWFAVAEHQGWIMSTELNAKSIFVLQVSGMLGLMCCVYLLVSVLKKMEFGARRELRDANAKLSLQATTDGLTGIPNRHCFEATLAKEWARHQRSGEPLSIGLIDADFFKAFNDEYGHLAGDECLRAVARALREAIHRPNDLCARFGGEEFAVILPGTDALGALQVAHNIRSQVRLLGIPHRRSGVDPLVTVSIGISTTVPTLHRSRQEFLHDVDMALYRAKEAGRDRVIQVTQDLHEAVY